MWITITFLSCIVNTITRDDLLRRSKIGMPLGMSLVKAGINLWKVGINSLAAGRSDHSLKLVNFKLISMINILSIICEIAIRWMPQHHWSLVNIFSLFLYVCNFTTNFYLVVSCKFSLIEQPSYKYDFYVINFPYYCQFQDRAVLATVRALMEGAKADGACQNLEGYTPLHEAVRSGNVAAVEGLLLKTYENPVNQDMVRIFQLLCFFPMNIPDRVCISRYKVHIVLLSFLFINTWYFLCCNMVDI